MFYFIFPISIHFLPLVLSGVTRGLDPIPSIIGGKAGFLDKSPELTYRDKQPSTLTSTGNFTTNSSNPTLEVFGLWQAAGGTQRKPIQTRGENTQTPHRKKALARGFTL